MVKKIIFKKKYKLILLLFCFFNLHFVEAQITLSGIVVNQTGIPIDGATVKLRSFSEGFITKSDGKFSLNVNNNKLQNDFLIVSFVGYETYEIKVNLQSSQSNFIIELIANANLLDEVVTTGSAQKSKRRELGNSINTISGGSLQNSGSGNLFNSLQGKVLGAQITQNSGDPAGGVTIRIRGIKSLQGSSDPLYVIDGVIISNYSTNVSQTALNAQAGDANLGQNRAVDINPDDIETINIINGAAAAAQYGSRASNGVVLITTKKGKTGAAQFNFSTNFGINELRKKVPITTYGKQFGLPRLRLNTITILDPNGGVTNPPYSWANTNGVTLDSVYRNGTETYLASNLADVTRYDYQDLIFRQAFTQDHNLNISGGTNNTKYYFSVGYLKNEGIIKGTDFNRINLKSRLDQTVNKWFKFSLGLSYINSFSNEKANGNVFYSPINSINITNNIYDITKRDASGNLQAVEPSRVNPLSTIEDMTFTQGINRTISNVQLNFNPIKNLTIDWITGVDYYNQVGRSFIKAYPYQAVAGLPAERWPNGFASHTTNSVFLINNDLNINYNIIFNQDFNLNLLAGFNHQFQQVELLRTSGQSLAPFIETINGATGSTVTSGYGIDKFSLFGTYGQATFGYKSLLYITGAIRQDNSTKFSASQATQYYPKLSGSLIVSEFYKNSNFVDIINSIKVRASYGQSGNIAGIGSYDRFWQFNSIAYLDKTTIVPSATLANNDVRPERMAEIEGGFDISFDKNRYNFSFTYFNQQITDLVVNRTLASSEGGTSIINNVGKMENTGLEIMVNIVPIRSKNWNWDVTFLYSSYKNKILDLGGTTTLIALNTVTGAPIYLIKGQSASQFYGTFYARDANGNFVLTNQGFTQTQKGTQSTTNPLAYTPSTTSDAFGNPSGNEVRGLIGNPNPDFTGSISSNLSYKGLTFSFVLDALQGAQVFNADKRTRQGVGIGDYAELEYRGQIKRGYIFSTYTNEEWRIDDGSFIKLREVSLRYRFNDLGKNSLIKALTIGVVGRNLLSWDNYNGYDPETNAGGNNDLFRGVDFGNVPIPRSYQVQLNLNF
ncbi:MAG: SusC/RagA family TonB-linked outer membrane protein [Alphaproteobacteria bacterium]|nr:SusC/RagA family TonB-linked outer membrane protein [Alphaproteobacteria bacterium]